MSTPEKQSRTAIKFEIVTVTCVGFLTGFLNSIVAVFGLGESWRTQFAFWSYGTAMIHMGLGLLILALVWYTGGGSLRSLGINLRPHVLPVSVLVFAAWCGLEWAMYAGYYALGLEIDATASRDFTESLRQAPAALGITFMILSVAREELLGRAYLITRLEHLGWRTSFAVVFSSALLAACHLYQGPLAALAHFAGFMVAAAYFARYRNTVVLVLAHCYGNVAYFVNFGA